MCLGSVKCYDECWFSTPVTFKQSGNQSQGGKKRVRAAHVDDLTTTAFEPTNPRLRRMLDGAPPGGGRVEEPVPLSLPLRGGLVGAAATWVDESRFRFSICLLVV